MYHKCLDNTNIKEMRGRKARISQAIEAIYIRQAQGAYVQNYPLLLIEPVEPNIDDSR